MERVRFVIPGEPQGKGRPRFGIGRTKSGGSYTTVRTPDKTIVYENLVKVEYQNQCGGHMFPDGSMLDMRILAYYSIPKSASKKKRVAMLGKEIRPTKKPDADNVIKIVADSLNGLAYKDDTQIVDCQVRKFYAESPRVVVTIEEVNG